MAAFAQEPRPVAQNNDLSARGYLELGVRVRARGDSKTAMGGDRSGGKMVGKLVEKHNRDCMPRRCRGGRGRGIILMGKESGRGRGRGRGKGRRNETGRGGKRDTQGDREGSRDRKEERKREDS